MDHEGAFAPYPELKPKFANIGVAQGQVNRAVSDREAAIKQFEDSAASHYLKNEDPRDAISKIFTGTGSDSIKKARSLMNVVKPSQAATNSVIGHTAEWVRDHIVKEVASGDKSQMAVRSAEKIATLRKHDAALRYILGDERMNNVYKTLYARQMQDVEGNRIRMMGIKGSPTEFKAAQRKAVQQMTGNKGLIGSVVEQMSPMMAALAGYHMQGLEAASGAGIGMYAVNHAAAHARELRNQIVDKAILNPQYAKKLSERYPVHPVARHQFLKRLSTLAMQSGINAQRSTNQQGNSP